MPNYYMINALFSIIMIVVALFVFILALFAKITHKIVSDIMYELKVRKFQNNRIENNLIIYNKQINELQLNIINLEEENINVKKKKRN